MSCLRVYVMECSKIVLAFFFITNLSIAQVGIGTTTPAAQLDVVASNQATPASTDGILIPRVDDFPIVNPGSTQDGMMIYATGSGTPAKGFYYWDNVTTSWIQFSTGGNDADWYKEATTNSPILNSDDIYTLGNVAIGKNIASFSLDIFTNDVSRTLNIENTYSVGNTYGVKNVISAAGTGYRYGIHNTLMGSGTGEQRAINNVISNSGDDFHYGIINNLSGSGSGGHVGTDNLLEGVGTGDQIGTVNKILNAGNGAHYGVLNEIRGAGTGYHYGTRNYLTGNGTGRQFGSSVSINNAGDSEHYGTSNSLNGLGSGSHYGTYNGLTANGSGDNYGVYNSISGAGSGTKYGSYTKIFNTSGGIQYGVYSEVLKSGSYAGYFLGDVYLGTNTANGYTLPSVDGAANQVLQTNGAGALGWETLTDNVNDADASITNEIQDLDLAGDDLTITNNGSATTIDLSSYKDHDWYKVGASSAPTTINDNIYTQGNVGIGTTTPDYKFSVNGVANLNEGVASGAALRVNGAEALWYNGTYFSWGFGGNANYFSDKVGIGVSAPGTKLHLKHSNSGASGGFKIENADTTNSNYWRMYVSSGVSGDLRLYSSVIGGTTITGAFNGTSGAYTSVSDRRLKKDFDELYFDWNNFMSLKTLTYQFKKQTNDERHIGLIAQEVQKIYPELVSYSKEEDIYHLDYSGAGIIAIKAVQELKKDVKLLSIENQNLKEQLSKYEQLEKRLQALEQK